MPSTYSTNLRITLMATGEDSGTWGDITNTNEGTLIEEAIVGYGTVAMADSNQTISISDGVSSTARKIVLELTGVLTAARELVVPTINKTYIVYNNTTGGYAVTVKTTAGTGISVANGLKRMLIVDAVNVVEALNSVGNFTVTGNLTLSGSLTLSAPLPVASGGTGVAISTGTTAVVLSNAPTITSPTLVTPTLGVATATSINKMAITAPATGSTLAVADGKTLTASSTLTFSGTDGTSFGFPSTSGTVVTLDATQTLTNKTLTAAALGSSTATTQTYGDNSTKVATTAYVDTASGQIASIVTGAVATGSTVMPVDDTIPQNTEGDQYMSLTITPKNASSKLNISVTFNGANSDASTMAVALFQDSTADALAVGWFSPSGVNNAVQVNFQHTMTSGTTSATTFKVRAGCLGTTTFNGASGNRFFGAKMASSIVIVEG